MLENEYTTRFYLEEALDITRDEAAWMYFILSPEFPRKKKKALRTAAKKLWSVTQVPGTKKITLQEYRDLRYARQSHLDEIWDRIQVSLANEEQMDVDTLKERRDA